MKTTELFAEQVLIGFSALVAIGFLCVPLTESNDIAKVWSTFAGAQWSVLAQAALGGAALGTAYLVGMLFDRYADTLLGNLERYNHLKFACKRQKRLRAEGKDEGSDPFPVARLRILVFASDNATAYASYLRTRMRLTRALAVIAPAFMVAVPVAWSEEIDVIQQVGIVILLVVYALVPTLLYWQPKWKSPPEVAVGSKGAAPPTEQLEEKPGPSTNSEMGNRIRKYRPFWLRLPRTDDKEGMKFVDHHVKEEELGPALDGWLGLGFLVLLLVGILVGSRADNPIITWTPIAAATVTMLAVWSWARVEMTFFTFVDDFERWHKPVQRPVKRISEKGG